jgi:penicillin-binding protein 1A
MSRKTPSRESVHRRANKSNKKSPKGRASAHRHWGLFVAKWLVILGIWGLVALGGILLWFGHDLPDTARLTHSTRKAGVTLLARDGSILATYGDLYGNFVELKDLPRHVPLAIMAIEDRRFYHHFGIDVLGVLRAVWANYRAGSVVQGGSTITQQLAKNFLMSEGLFNHTDRSLRRKVQELILALWLEAKFNKQQILSMYLNRVYLGAGTYGVDAAARKYFGKSARELTVYEAAVIAGLLKAPSKYSPTNNPELADERARVVLANMVEAGFIAQPSIEDITKARKEVTKAHFQAGSGRYFADWVFEYLPELVGDIDHDLIVKTTLDPRLQTKAERHLRDIMMTEGFAANAHQGAVVAMTPDGGVRVMVGGVDYAHSQFNRAVQAKRQLGSTFKVFVYLAALEKGYTPATLISDGPLKIGNWAPKNYKWQARGDVTLRTAMAYSLNTPVIRLTRDIGLKYVQNLAKRLGLTSPQPNDLTIALGAGEATLLELTAAYAAIANHGFGVWPYGITEVRTKNGKVLYKRQAQGAGRVIEPEHVKNILSMMQSVMREGTGRKAALDRPCAGKSGTSQKYRDAWFVGFTPDLVMGVWMGNDNEAYMEEISGGKLPGRLWHDFMADIHQGLPVKNFPVN